MKESEKMDKSYLKDEMVVERQGDVDSNCILWT